MFILRYQQAINAQEASEWRKRYSLSARQELRSRQSAGGPVRRASALCGLRGGDDGGGLFGQVFPAVDLLPGADEDALPDPGHAEPVNVRSEERRVGKERRSGWA